MVFTPDVLFRHIRLTLAPGLLSHYSARLRGVSHSGKCACSIVLTDAIGRKVV